MPSNYPIFFCNLGDLLAIVDEQVRVFEDSYPQGVLNRPPIKLKKHLPLTHIQFYLLLSLLQYQVAQFISNCIDLIAVPALHHHPNNRLGT